MPRAFKLLPLLMIAITATGCASLSAGEAMQVSDRIKVATGVAPRPVDQYLTSSTARVDALLADPLTPEAAAQIAVVNSPKVGTAFAQLGVARADLLDGVMPSNLMLHAGRLVPRNGEANILSYALGFDLMSLVTLPARQRAARGYWQGAKARAIGETLMAAGEARTALIEYVAANQNLDLLRQANEVSQAALLAAEAIFAAGNSTRLDVDRERLFAAEVTIALRQAETRLVPATERVNLALGLSGEQVGKWQAIARLPAPPSQPSDATDIETKVVAASTDLAQASGVLTAARAGRGMSGLTSLLPSFEVSAEQEREDGVWKRGGSITAGLPLFGLGQSSRLRADSALQLAQVQERSLQAQLRSEARVAVAIAESARQVAVDRREIILPLSASVFSGMQLNFNAMQIGIFQLLEAKRTRLEAGQASIMATRDYWIAQANLDLLLQGSRQSGNASGEVSATASPRQSPAH